MCCRFWNFIPLFQQVQIHITSSLISKYSMKSDLLWEAIPFKILMSHVLNYLRLQSFSFGIACRSRIRFLTIYPWVNFELVHGNCNGIPYLRKCLVFIKAFLNEWTLRLLEVLNGIPSTKCLIVGRDTNSALFLAIDALLYVTLDSYLPSTHSTAECGQTTWSDPSQVLNRV